jgi:hypothetical protein
MIDNPLYEEQREKVSGQLDLSTIDSPVVEMIRDFSKLPYCFTLQSCWGHFLCEDKKDERNVDPLPSSGAISSVEYRIAYVCLCIQNSDRGKLLLEDLRGLPSIDTDFVQFGCAEWFWERHVNSYVLQVEPLRHRTKDKVVIGFKEALHVEKVRNKFFSVLEQMVQTKVTEETGPGIPLGKSREL